MNTQVSTTSEPTPTPAFDPDFPGEQPEAALRGLIKQIEIEKQMLRFSKFGQGEALALGLLLVNLATSRALPVAIDIRKPQHILFHVSLPGATPDNDAWIERKSRTTERYCEPSLLVGLRGRLGGGRLEDHGWFNQTLFASHGGAFPIHVNGTGFVATVTVSGLPQQEDHDLVVEALRVFLNQNP
ncbi:heme-degrading domain-containing protein [Pseudarthrobacter sp. NamE5]|uniref:heme-degrading domain-containing protein n=1 Tax=Pseudarthrobacter sp. NamE5 TaxID=2576839 RepID=UPI00110AF485|nr:heme-degrading domain-containing protein [Pseudarthrobacter sp. NamE5]TLM88263.1 heme-degrading domain-containing protein [Pseudarthrobacter sp. NamE5]